MTEAVSTDDLMVLDRTAQELLFTEARTANAFTEEPVSEEQLRAVYELTKFGPSSANTQPLRILFVAKGEGRDRLIPHLAEGNRAKTASAPMVAVLAADLDFHQNIPQIFPIRPELKDYFAGDDAKRTEHARFNAILQGGYFILGVRAAGLAAGPMTGIDAKGIDDEFFSHNAWRTLMVVNMGHPAENAWFDRLPRLDYDQVVTHV